MWVDKEEREDGFSLVELLVVIVIIGILSSIAIAAFLNQRQKANDAVVETEMRKAINTLETMMVDYPNAPNYSVSTQFTMGGTSSFSPLDDLEGWDDESIDKSGELVFTLRSVPKGHKDLYKAESVLDRQAFSLINNKGERTDNGVFVSSIDSDPRDGYILVAYHSNSDKYRVNEKDLENSESAKNFLAFNQEMEEKYGKGYDTFDDLTEEEQEILGSLVNEYLETYRNIEKVLVYDSTTGKSEEMVYSEARTKFANNK